MARRRLLVVVNRNASRAGQLLGPALAALTASGFDLDIRQPDNAGGADRLVRAEGPSVDAIVIAGGDGTIGGTAAALLAAERPVGILPLGTANDLALTLGIPADPVEAAGIIAHGHTRQIDVGKVNDIHFVNVASIGLSTTITENQSVELKQQWGFLSYAIAAIRTLTEAEHFPARITCDGEPHQIEAFQIAVGNGVHYGGGLTVAEAAAIDDGILDVYAIESRSVGELVATAPVLRTGAFRDRDDISSLRCRRVRIDTAEPLPVNTDGEITTETPAEFSVLRRALEVFISAPERAPGD